MDYEIFKSSLGPVSYRKLGHGRRKILFFHGFPGSSSQVRIFREFTESHDLEVCCFDRPGYNYTEIKTKNPLEASLTISEELVNSLDWESFEVVTVSGGTPFGVSYAMKNPGRVFETRVICGLGSLKIPEVRRQLPVASYLTLKLLPKLPGSILQKILRPKTSKMNPIVAFFLPASAPDMELARNSSISKSLGDSLKEALRQKALGPQQDAIVFLSDWMTQFEIYKNPIHFWHGDQDLIIPHPVSKHMAPLFPKGGFTLVKNEGHISLPVKSIKEIIGYHF